MRHVYAALSCMLLSFASQAQVVRLGSEELGVPTITVQGEGLVRVLPDKATVRFAVVTRDANPERARQRNEEAARNALNALRALGIEERNLFLEALTLQPVREYDPQRQRWEERGYEVQRQVRAELTQLDLLPEAVMRVVQQGANRLLGVHYDVSTRAQVQMKALQEAVRNAQDKARQMLAVLGKDVGDPIRIHEQSLEFPRPMWTEAAMLRTTAADATPEAYAAGEIEVRARVEVIFALR
ncbi:SIMPL domain-containing protein [Rhodothermus bifroesti]|uniref:DUF541 domain-containing protein n=1 Tax=Rhodothermus marinus TaxID=29549 RepID=A0A7V2B120_RHOMR|nr:SIMPL domain-containing protein [Rhodothermus bifroesti]GBD00993.1 26 kDa periplasmic immunogenic protein [bacterium HR18]